MKVRDLQPKQGNIEIELEIVSVDEPREFQKFGMTGKVANAKAKDDSGEIKLTLWNDQIDQVKAGDKIKISKGYVSEWQGEKQLTTGKFGKLEVIGSESNQDKKVKKKVEEDLDEEMDEEDVEEDS